MEFGAVERGPRAHLPRASVAVRGDEGSGAGGRRAHAQPLAARAMRQRRAGSARSASGRCATLLDADEHRRRSPRARRARRVARADPRRARHDARPGAGRRARPPAAARRRARRVSRRAAVDAEAALRAARRPARRLPVGRRRARQELPDGQLLRDACRSGARRACISTRSCATCTRSSPTLKHEADPLATVAARIARRCAAHLLRRVPRLRHRRRDDPRPPAARRCSTHGVVFVMTSNYPPDGLWPNGLQRERFLPTIALLKQWLDVVEVDAGIDYRLRALEQVRDATTRRSAPRPTPRSRRRSRRCAPGRDEDPKLVDRGPHARRAPARRQRRLVRLRDAVRRPALAARLPRARAAASRCCSCPASRG